jgi:hypothetical protein
MFQLLLANPPNGVHILGSKGTARRFSSDMAAQKFWKVVKA